jgi:hypothetical protein
MHETGAGVVSDVIAFEQWNFKSIAASKKRIKEERMK